MDKAKKKTIKRIIAAACIVAVVTVLALMPVIAKKEPEAKGPQPSILTATVTRQSVTAEIVGGGVLAGEDPEQLTVPAQVKLTGYLVANGDAVKAGDPIATVDRVSVMKAITQVQETLEYLSEEIKSEGSRSTDETVKALAGGKVKHLYAQKGDSVQAVMLEHGALAVLTLDGLMAVDLTVESNLLAGDAVTVTLEDGTIVAGKVKSNLAGEMTVTLEDDDYTDGQSVMISTQDGVLGSGQLYILSPWKATAYAGTVTGVSVKEGAETKVGQTLMKLSDAGYTAQYHQMVNQRQTYEELMLELFELYQTCQLKAPCDGMVTGLDKDSAQLLSARGGFSLELLANAPNGDDLTEYVNYVGKVTGIASNAWTLLVNPQTLQVPDYMDLTEVPRDTSAMNMAQLFEQTDLPVYELTEGVWQQTTAAAGDILLFAFDSQGQPVWAVRVEKGQSAGQQGGNQSGGQMPGGNMGGGNRPSGGNWGGSTPQKEEPFEKYGLDVAQIAQVTPQTQITLEISVDEMDVVKLQPGMTAQVKVEALGGQKCTAQITDVSNTGENNGGQSKYAVVLTMDRLENMLSGMNATATISLESKEDVLTLPVTALVEENGKTLVYTGYNGKKEVFTGPVEVEVGASDGEYVQILSGLQEGDSCCYAYYETPVVSNTAQTGSTGMGGMGGMGGFGGGPSFGR